MYNTIFKAVGAAAVALGICVVSIYGQAKQKPAATAATPASPSLATFVDSRDGTVYKKVTIGTQTWMAENLNYDMIERICSSEGADGCGEYGGLYGWESAVRACPPGWHLPKIEEWITLANYAGGEKTAGKKLKSKSGWKKGNGTDSYGFSASPGGCRGCGGASMHAAENMTYYGYWWSASWDTLAGGGILPLYTSMSYNDENLAGDADGLKMTLSVRCVQDETVSNTYRVFFDPGVSHGDPSYYEVTVNAGSSIKLPDQGSMDGNGYTFGGWNTDRRGRGANYDAGSSYTPASDIVLFARWCGSDGGCEKKPPAVTAFKTFVDGRDNKTYKKVTIGSQSWMAENLNYDAADSKCYQKPANCDKYGRLYTWDTAVKVCPGGWHLPSDAEWETLVINTGREKRAGERLKSETGWWDYNNGTNEYGFSALPGGSGYSNGSFFNAGNNGYWWSATEEVKSNGSKIFVRSMSINSAVKRDSYEKKGRFHSVRCVQD